jgi:hypothetical protein
VIQSEWRPGTAPAPSVNREIDEEFHLSLFICHLMLVIVGGKFDSMPNVHWAISGPMNDGKTMQPEPEVNARRAIKKAPSEEGALGAFHVRDLTG